MFDLAVKLLMKAVEPVAEISPLFIFLEVFKEGSDLALESLVFFGTLLH